MSMPQDPNYGGYPPPNPYGQPATPYGYGYGMQREHPEGTTVLILGILGLVLCQLLGPFAWSKGNKVLAEIDAQPGMYSNRSTVNAGRICGIIASVLMLFTVAIIVLAVVIGAASSTTN